MSGKREQLIDAIWFGKQAVEDGFVAPEEFAQRLFGLMEEEGSLDAVLEREGMLTPFQRKKLRERLPPLPGAFQEGSSGSEGGGSEAGGGSGSGGHALAPGERYQLGEILQQGGSGRIYRAHDPVVGRDVAIKCLIDPQQSAARIRFENEYKITGSLDHPNIISVHDACHSEELGPFYAMRLLEGRTLRAVLREAQEHGIPGRTALLRSFMEICAAVAYAHSRGVLHRDLKPSNIMVGELGEVQVMDWGIARYGAEPLEGLSGEKQPVGRPVRRLGAVAGEQSPELTRHGSVLGTPGYMAPEQARGELGLDARADIFALGCILYEILTGRFAFPGATLELYLQSLSQGPPTPPIEVDPSVGEELDEIVMRALAMEPEERFSSVRELIAALSLYLEGTKAQKMRKQRSLSRVVEGIQARDLMQKKEAQAESILGQARGQRARMRPYDPIEKKRPIWSKEQQAGELEKAAMVHLGESISAFTQALALDPDSQEARRQLADLYYERLLAAERKRDGAQIAYHEAMLERHNDGQYDSFLQDQGVLWLLSDPPGAEVVLHRLHERDLILQPGGGRDLGPTPLGPITLAAGSYLAVLKKPGFADVHVPILVQRDHSHVSKARMYHPEHIPEGYVYVPQGRFLMGGDPFTASAGRSERPFLDDMFVATFPVTIAEYIEFLNRRGEAKDNRPHVPRRSPDGGYYLLFDEELGWELPEIDEDGDTWDPQWPVFAISWYDAEAYATWRGQDQGLPCRLPLSAELEKAARGVDGRYYPWGDRFDATFCKMGHSRPGPPKPEPVGAYPLDVSVYGVRDLAGGIREWCKDDLEPADSAMAFGGLWSGSELTSRAAHRWNLQKGHVAPGLGFRLLLEAEVQPYHQGFPDVEVEEGPAVSVAIEMPTAAEASVAAGHPKIQQRLADPQLWQALAEARDDWVLTQLALAATTEAPWVVIQGVGEEIPLASAGDTPPEYLPQEIFRESPTKSGSEARETGSFEVHGCGQHGFLVLPKDHELGPEALQPLTSAVALVLGRKSEREHAALREKQAQRETAAAIKELTVVREAFATIAPDTFFRESYPLLDGRSRPMRQLFEMLDRLIPSEVNVFIRGESGVGKERVARTIHQQGPNPDGPFVAVNCGAIPENLVESELFGHVKGAFTGAEKNQIGLFRQADGGTLFLDEIAELSLEAQVKLLRALQNRAVRPVGGVAEYPFQARILAATHKDLKALVDEGHFREDLYWRLVVMEVEIPPLRQRPEDIPILLQRFLDDWQREADISEEAMSLLQQHTWPGNIRELENELRRALVVADQQIQPDDLSAKIRASAAPASPKLQGKLRDIVAQVERDAISRVLQQSDGNKSQTARVLGLSKRGLQLKMKRYDLA